ncbi:PWWP domain [Musa troglodytarum]|uniref:PWWP domain n=1 Tax=Musa troglodytarum TaxID=320322 RepID=A0A9E7I7F5_9LILI|nr:PWWP domain [Musa troglodytarum]URE46721.1 PWWP domain [Musa troglodytarum]
MNDEVVDEKSIDVKPKKKSKDEILIRLYGTYDYLYMDPLKCNMEFENFLKQDNITMKEAFQKSLAEDLSHTISSGCSKRQVSHFREHTASESPKGKMQKQIKTARNQKEVGSPSMRLGSSDKQTEGSSKQKRKYDARDKAARNTKTKEDEGREQRINVNFGKEAIGGGGIRQGTPANHNIAEKEITGASGVNSTKRDCLRRSPRNANKKHEMEMYMIEWPRCQYTESYGSGKLNMMDKVNSGASNTKVMGQLCSEHLRQMDRVQINEKLPGKTSKEISGDEAAGTVIVKKYTLRKRKQKDTQLEVKKNFISEISEEKGKENHESGLQGYVDEGVTRDLVPKRIRQNDFQELNCKNVADQTMEMFSNEVAGNRAIEQGEARKNIAMKTVRITASRCKNMKPSDLEEQKRGNATQPKKIESLKSDHQTMFSAPESAVDISARKTKVMRSLGLIPPSGSPFHKNGMLEVAHLKT